MPFPVVAMVRLLGKNYRQKNPAGITLACVRIHQIGSKSALYNTRKEISKVPNCDIRQNVQNADSLAMTN